MLVVPQVPHPSIFKFNGFQMGPDNLHIDKLPDEVDDGVSGTIFREIVLSNITPTFTPFSDSPFPPH